MELDDFKSAWQEMDRRLAGQAVLTRQLWLMHGADKARRHLRPLWVGQLIQLFAGIVLVLMAVAFWSRHRDSTHLLVYGIALHVYGLMFIISAARNFFLLGHIDYAAPVVAIQRQLAALRAWRIKVEFPVFATVGCFMWIPMMLILFKVLLGADIWIAAPLVVWLNIAAGFVCLLIVLAVLAVARRPGFERFAAVVARHGGGRSVEEAERAMVEIARFAEE
jgi:hypothetical protein